MANNLLISALAGMICWAISAQAWAADCTAQSPRANKAYTNTKVNLRAYPGTYGDVLVTLPAGQVVYAYSRYNEWSRVNVATMNITGYIVSKYLSEECVDGAELRRIDLTRPQIVAILMTQSQGRYSGSCPCPYYTDRAGRRCGGRSAYSRPGGASPLCYESDATPAMIENFQSQR